MQDSRLGYIQANFYDILRIIIDFRNADLHYSKLTGQVQ